jgi:hypothetical protein
MVIMKITKSQKTTSVGQDVEKLEPCILLVENSMEVPQKIKNGRLRVEAHACNSSYSGGRD